MYSIKLQTTYDDKTIQGLYAGKNEQNQVQLALHPDDEFMQYVRLEGAQEAALSIPDSYTRKIVDSEGKLIA